MAIVSPGLFPLSESVGASEISYRQPVLDGAVQDLLIDGPTWAWASGQRTSFGDAPLGVSYPVAPTLIWRAYSILSAGRKELICRLGGTNAKLTFFADTVLGVNVSSVVLDTGAGSGQVSGDLTGLAALGGAGIRYRVQVESSDGVGAPIVQAWRMAEKAILSVDL